MTNMQTAPGRLRIAIVTQAVRREDGQGRVNYEIALELLSRGHSLLLIAAEVDPGLLAMTGVAWVVAPKSRLPTYLLRDQVFAARATAALIRRRREYDLVVANGFVAWCGCDINLVHFVHAAWRDSPAHPIRGQRLTPSALYQWAYTALNVRLERFGFRRSKAIVAVSELVRQQLIRCGTPAERMTVIPNGVDLEAFAPRPGNRAAFGLPDAPFMAMFAGDLQSSRKNLDTVLNALAATPGIHLAIAGDAARSRYPAMARKLGIADRTHFLGRRSDIAALMCAVDVFAFPSHFEPFGLVLLEASACGLPVITSPDSGACDALQGEGLIVLDQANDTAGLVRALTMLQSDPARRRRMGAKARLAAERLSWTAATQRYHAVVESIAMQRAAA